MKKALLLAAAASLTGCADLSGLSGAESDFPCARDSAEAFCGSMQEAFRGVPEKPPAGSASDSPVETGSEAFSAPERVPERIVRLLVSSYVDDDGDLHEAHWIHTGIAKARWKNRAGKALPSRTAARKEITPLASSEELPEK